MRLAALHTMLFFLGCCSLEAQLIQVFHEPFYSDDGTMADYPDGATTYRIYAQLADGEDVISAVYAESTHPLTLGTVPDDSIWNAEFGAATGDAINPAFFPTFPEIEYDSFVTIGRASSGDPGGGITALLSLPVGAMFDDSFAADGPNLQTNLYMEDGVWFSTPDNANTFGQGENFTVLLAQITTTGDLQYQLNLQMLDGGVGGVPMSYVWDGNVDVGNNEVDGSDLGMEYYPSSPTCAFDAVELNYTCNWDEETGTIQELYSIQVTPEPLDCTFDSLRFVHPSNPDLNTTINLGSYSTSIESGQETDISAAFTDFPSVDDWQMQLYYNNEQEWFITEPQAFGNACGVIPGCMQPGFCNFDPGATDDDGSCTNADNLDPSNASRLHVYPPGEVVPRDGTVGCDFFFGVWFCCEAVAETLLVEVQVLENVDLGVRMYDSEMVEVLTANNQPAGMDELIEFTQAIEGEVYFINVLADDFPAFGAAGNFNIGTSAIAGTPLVGDFDGNGLISVSDLTLILQAYGMTEPAAYDLDNSGLIDTVDVLLTIVAFFQFQGCQ